MVPVEGGSAVVVIRHPLTWQFHQPFLRLALEHCVAFLLDEQASAVRKKAPASRQLWAWANHVHSWRSTARPVLLLRYEDLLDEPLLQFSRLAQFLKLPTEPNLIAEAVANTSFQKLRGKEEKEGGFSERPEGCERFFRSGRSGEGQEQLTTEQLGKLEEAFGSTLGRFNYGMTANHQT